MKEDERKKIYDVFVNRVDGVNDPSTGRSFLLMKSASETSTASQRLIESATSVIESFTKEATQLTKEQAESIQGLAGSIGVELKLAEKVEDEDEEDEDKDKDDEKKEVKKSADEQVSMVDVDDVESMMKKMLGPILREEIKKMAKEDAEDQDDDEKKEVKKSAAEDDDSVEQVTSKRPRSQDTFVKNKGEESMGEGLFENIIFE